MNQFIKIFHSDWNGECKIIDNNQIIRLDVTDEKGKKILDKNKLIIYWEKWSERVDFSQRFFHRKKPWNRLSRLRQKL